MPTALFFYQETTLSQGQNDHNEVLAASFESFIARTVGSQPRECHHASLYLLLLLRRSFEGCLPLPSHSTIYARIYLLEVTNSVSPRIDHARWTSSPLFYLRYSPYRFCNSEAYPHKCPSYGRNFVASGLQYYPRSQQSNLVWQCGHPHSGLVRHRCIFFSRITCQKCLILFCSFIATKILLGMIVALLMAYSTISCRVEFISSTRDTVDDPRSKRTQTIAESALCILLPIIYMSLRKSFQWRTSSL